MRYVARATGADHALLAREAAGALASFGDDPAGLVTACRRLIEHHPTNGSLWWLAARVLLAENSAREAFDAAADLDGDSTPQVLAGVLPEGGRVCVLGWPELIGEALVARGDLRVLVVDCFGGGSALVNRLARLDVDVDDVAPSAIGAAAADADVMLLEAAAVGPSAFVSVAGSRAAAAVARHAGREVWLVAGVGRLLPERMFDALAGRLEASGEPWELDEELVPLDLVDRVVGPLAAEAVEAALLRTDCPVAAELLRPS